MPQLAQSHRAGPPPKPLKSPAFCCSGSFRGGVMLRAIAFGLVGYLIGDVIIRVARGGGS